MLFPFCILVQLTQALSDLQIYETLRAQSFFVALAESESIDFGWARDTASTHVHLMEVSRKFPETTGNIQQILPFFAADCTSLKKLSAKSVDATSDKISRVISDSMAACKSPCKPHAFLRKFSLALHAASVLEFVRLKLQACSLSSEIFKVKKILLANLSRSTHYSSCMRDMLLSVVQAVKTSSLAPDFSASQCVRGKMRPLDVPAQTAALEPWVRRIGNQIHFVASEISDHFFPIPDPGPAVGMCGGSGQEISRWTRGGGPLTRLPALVSCVHESEISGCVKNPRTGKSEPTEVGSYSEDGISVFPCPSDFRLQFLRGGLRSIADCDAVAICPGRSEIYDARLHACVPVRAGFVAAECDNVIFRCPNVAGPTALGVSVDFHPGTCTWNFRSVFDFAHILPQIFSISVAVAGNFDHSFPIIGGLTANSGTVLWWLRLRVGGRETSTLELRTQTSSLVIGNLSPGGRLTLILAQDERFLFLSDGRRVQTMEKSSIFSNTKRICVGPFKDARTDPWLEGISDFPTQGTSVHLMGISDQLNFATADVDWEARVTGNFRSPFLLEGDETVYESHTEHRDVWSVAYRSVAKISDPVDTPTPRRPREMGRFMVSSWKSSPSADEIPDKLSIPPVWPSRPHPDRLEISESPGSAFVYMVPLGFGVGLFIAGLFWSRKYLFQLSCQSRTKVIKEPAETSQGPIRKIGNNFIR